MKKISCKINPKGEKNPQAIKKFRETPLSGKKFSAFYVSRKKKILAPTKSSTHPPQNFNGLPLLLLNMTYIKRTKNFKTAS